MKRNPRPPTEPDWTTWASHGMQSKYAVYTVDGAKAYPHELSHGVPDCTDNGGTLRRRGGLRLLALAHSGTQSSRGFLSGVGSLWVATCSGASYLFAGFATCSRASLAYAALLGRFGQRQPSIQRECHRLFDWSCCTQRVNQLAFMMFSTIAVGRS